MRLLSFQLPALSLLLFVCSSAVTNVFASHSGLQIGYKHKRNWSAFSNRTTLQPEDPYELQKRDGTKYVFIHHIVGNTYPYVYADWLDDMNRIAAKGIDAIALNIGADSWQPTQVAVAYQAAKDSGTGIKLFFSFDLTSMACDLNDLVSRVNLYASHPNQFKVNGKVMISSYSGDCLGNAGWASLKAQTNGYLMPFIWGLEGQFQSWPALDSWYCWGCAWPQGDWAKNTDDDNYYLGQLGSRYAATVSGWMFAHLPSKNFYLRGDDWLIVSRWQELMQMRNSLTFVEMLTWNDYGESDYFGPFKGAQPSGTYYAQSYPHSAWFDLSQYYISAFKTGVYPAITQSTIYFWARPHPASATASGDSLGKPTGWDWTEDSMWAAVFSSATSTVVLQCGSSTSTFSVNAGVTTLKIPLAAGKMTVKMIRNGQTIINYTPSDFSYVTNPTQYNYNAWVGSATATSEGTGTSSSASSSTSQTTSATTTASTTTPTSTAWSSFGCVAEGTTGTRRALTGASFQQTTTMTPQVCQALCSGYAYAGVEYGYQCYCGNSLTNNGAAGTVAASSNCNSICPGDSTKSCGGSWYLNVYKSGTSTTTATITATASTPTSTAWSEYGCVNEGTTGSRRALTAASFVQSNMTPTVCQSLCGNYNYAGVEFGTECYCGNTLTNNGASGAVTSTANCQSACGGDSTKKCGGSWTLSVYTKVATPAWTSVGCYVDATTRMLQGSSNVVILGMTTEKCINTCATAGFTMAATEAGQECYCGSQVFKEGGAGVSAASSTCNTACDGNSSEMCGGGWRLNLYLKPGTAAP